MLEQDLSKIREIQENDQFLEERLSLRVLKVNQEFALEPQVRNKYERKDGE